MLLDALPCNSLPYFPLFWLARSRFSFKSFRLLHDVLGWVEGPPPPSEGRRLAAAAPQRTPLPGSPDSEPEDCAVRAAWTLRGLGLAGEYGSAQVPQNKRAHKDELRQGSTGVAFLLQAFRQIRGGGSIGEYLKSELGPLK